MNPTPFAFLVRLGRWLIGRDGLGYVEHWTPARAREYERQNRIAEGRVVEPTYTWPRRFAEAAEAARRRRQLRSVRRSA